MKNTQVVDDNHDSKDNDSVVSATGVNTQFAYWQKELLKLPNAHAIIHDKIVVIDPMTPDCVVITGSHNQGFRASYANDENFIIVKGHQPLAEAYATHVMDVYDHYRWRFTLKTTPTKDAFSGLDPTPKWQDGYYLPDSDARRETLFWTGQLPMLPDAPAPAVPMQPVQVKSKGDAAKAAGKPKKKASSTAKSGTAKTAKKSKKAKKAITPKAKKAKKAKAAKKTTTRKKTSAKKKKAVKAKKKAKKTKAKKSRGGRKR